MINFSNKKNRKILVAVIILMVAAMVAPLVISALLV